MFTVITCNYQLIYVRTLFPKNSCAGVECQQFFYLGNNMTWLDLVFFGGGLHSSIWQKKAFGYGYSLRF